MKNFQWTKIKSSSFNEEDSSKIHRLVNTLSSKLNVNEEYLQTFRTKSYIEISDEIQKQRKMEATNISSSSSSSNLTHLPKCLLEPNPELLNDVFGSFKIHHLLINYFKATLESYKTCELILESLHQTRTNHSKIRRVMKLAKRVSNPSTNGEIHRCSAMIFRELSSFSHLKNPFSIINPVEFRALHENHLKLLQNLTNKRKEIQRKLKVRKIWKKVVGVSFVISNAVVLITLLVLAFHSVAGIVVAPGLVGCFISLLQKRNHNLKAISLELVIQQMDIAAKSVYIMINDFDTLSRMVARLESEIEQLKAVAEMCIRSRRWEIVKEAAKEFVAEDDAIVEQMEEVEQHIYLCFLTINRSRRLVIQEIIGSQHQNG